MNPQPASFFPTALEVSNGIRWLKQNRLFATAAVVTATAISVLAYAKTSAAEDEPIERTVSWCENLLENMKTCKLSDDEEEDTDDADEESERCLCHTLASRGGRCENSFSRNCAKTPLPTRPSSAAVALPILRKNTSQDAGKSPEWGWYVSTTPPEEFYLDVN